MPQFTLLSVEELKNNADELARTVLKEHGALNDFSKLPPARQEQLSAIDLAFDDMIEGKALAFTKNNKDGSLKSVSMKKIPLYFHDGEKQRYLTGAILYHADTQIRKGEYENSWTTKIFGKTISNFINPPEGNKIFNGSTLLKGAAKAVGHSDENPLTEKDAQEYIAFYRRAYLAALRIIPAVQQNHVRTIVKDWKGAVESPIKKEASVYFELDFPMRRLYDIFFDRKKDHQPRPYNLKSENADRNNLDIQKALFSDQFRVLKNAISNRRNINEENEAIESASEFKMKNL